jgi:SAM-dependent methyltransferase
MWVEYYMLLLAGQGPAPETALDVCCGTGTVAELVAREGVRVTGIDSSAAMVEAARAKARSSDLPLQFECADATNFDLGECFDGAYSFFDSLNYIASLDSYRRALACVGKHLRPGAIFVFDLNTAYAFEQRMFDQRSLRSGAKLRYDWKGDWDPATRIIRVDMRFWHCGQELEETHVQRAHSEEETRDALLEAGFTDVRAYNSYTLDRPRARSDRVHYVAVRR